MRRIFVLLCVPFAAGLLAWTLRTPCPSRPAHAPVAARLQPLLNPQTPSCKPDAPIAVTLTVPDDGAAGVVRAKFSVRPVLELSDLHWSWVLSQDVHLVDGADAGVATPQRGTITEREVGLQMPNDGLHHTARLVVSGVLRGASVPDAAGAAGDAAGAQPVEPELVTVERTLSWGPPEKATPTVLSPDADTGALVEVAVVPTSYTPARASRVGGR